MPQLTLPAGFVLPDLITELAPGDTMFDGSVDHYLRVGLSARKVIAAAMIGVPEPRSVLDLPCGFGRVTRILRASYPAASITVCDLDRAAVDFTAATFRARGVYSTHNFRDLQLGGPFDLIWVGSLLTHLPEHQTRQFLDFAARHMGPNSRLVVTSHGEHVATQLRARRYGLSESAACGLIVQYLNTGYGYRGYGGDPAYGISLAARAWYETLLDGSPLRLQAYYERGWDRHQDVLVIRSAQTGRKSRQSRFADLPFDQPSVPLPLPGDEQALRDAKGVCRFDEDWYRNTFSDVASAVQDGTYDSGLAHYLLYGWQEGRQPFDPAQAYARRTDSSPGAWLNGVVGGATRIDEAWSVSPEEIAEDAGWYWMAHPTVRARSNALASGDPNQDAYHRLATLLQERGWTLPIRKSVSIGCGFGGLERDLSARRLVVEIDAYDIATGAVAEAERQARELGLLNIHYHVANLEALDLPPQSVEAVFAHSSVHHVERLEALYAVVQRALRPGGVFHLHEYVGPTRFQWTDSQLELANGFLDSLPERLRRQPNGELKEWLRRPTVEEMIAADPSEAVRSADLVGALTRYFDILELRPLGGTLAHIALGGIAQNFVPSSAEDDTFLQRLFAIEDEAMASGIIGSDFATITAIPKPLNGIESTPKRRNRSAMRSFLTARVASLFPPVRRLLEAINYLYAAVMTPQTHQDRPTSSQRSVASNRS
jgi:SAM-dependent methyltransferase